MLLYSVSGARQFSVFTATLDVWINARLLTSMANVQVEDVHASFLFVGDLNDHHQKWL